MLRVTLSLLVFLLACTFQPPASLIVYRAVPVRLPDGGLLTRTLTITGSRSVLGVERRPEGIVVRVGTAPRGDYDDLRTALVAALHLRGDATRSGLDVETFQINARLGEETIDLVRDPSEPLERDVKRAVEALAAIWDATPPAADPVAAVEPYLASENARVRGAAAVVLTQVFGADWSTPSRRAAAEAALRAHLEVEEDRAIVHGIRDVIDQNEKADAD